MYNCNCILHCIALDGQEGLGRRAGALAAAFWSQLENTPLSTFSSCSFFSSFSSSLSSSFSSSFSSFSFSCFSFSFLASQDAIEVMSVTDSLTYLLSVLIDLTDMTLVRDDTYRRLFWCDPDHPDHPDESYLMMKVTQWWKLHSDESYPVMKVTEWWKLSSDERYPVMKVI